MGPFPLPRWSDPPLLPSCGPARPRDPGSGAQSRHVDLAAPVGHRSHLPPVRTSTPPPVVLRARPPAGDASGAGPAAAHLRRAGSPRPSSSSRPRPVWACGSGPGERPERVPRRPSTRRPALVLADVEHLDAAAVRHRRDVPVHVLAPAPVPDGVFRRALDAGAVAVLALPDDRARLTALLADLDRPRQGRVVAVYRGLGRGGGERHRGRRSRCGRRRSPTLLVDLDPWGPGLGRLLGGQTHRGDHLGRPAPASTDGWRRASCARPCPATTRCRCCRGPTNGPSRWTTGSSRRSSPPALAATTGWSSTCRVARAQSPDLLGLCDLVVLAGREHSRRGRCCGPGRSRRCGRPVPRWACWSALVAGPCRAPTWRGSSRRRCWGRSVTTAGCASTWTPGLGPVRGRRSPVARAADEVLDAAAPDRRRTGAVVTTAAVTRAAEQVRAQLARDSAELTPEVVAAALRADGRPVGDVDGAGGARGAAS